MTCMACATKQRGLSQISVAQLDLYHSLLGTNGVSLVLIGNAVAVFVLNPRNSPAART